jgi:excisionase family DNA binding protein
MALLLLKLPEAAERLGVSTDTLRRKVWRREIACRRPYGPRGEIRFAETDLSAYIESIAQPAAFAPGQTA